MSGEIQIMLDEVGKRVAEEIPAACRFQLFILGSFARDEATYHEAKNGICYESDLDLYLLVESHDADSTLARARASLAGMDGPEISLNGNNYSNFSSFQPKQWLIDAAHSHQILAESHAGQENPFSRFIGLTPSLEDLLRLVMNRMVDANLRPNSPSYELSKLCMDMATALLGLKCLYRTSYAERLGALEELKTLLLADELFPSGLVRPFTYLASECFLAKLDRGDGGRRLEHLESLGFRRLVREMSKYVIIALVTEITGRISGTPLEAYRQLAFSQGWRRIAKDWLRQLVREPASTMDLLTSPPLLAGPMDRVYYQALGFFLEEDKSLQAEAIHIKWALLCKNT